MNRYGRDRGQYVALFPGLGGKIRPAGAGVSAVLAPAWWVFDAVDDVADQIGIAAPSTLLDLENYHPVGDDLQAELMLFGLAVGLYEILTTRAAPAALLGHSLGFLPALVSAKAFTVSDGCRIIHIRHQELRRYPPPAGGMVSIEADVHRTAGIAAAVGGLTVACANTPTRTVLCGLDESLTQFCERARGLGYQTYRLPVRHPYHGPHMAQTLSSLRVRLDGIRQQSLQTPVFSATTRRFCSDRDDLLGDLVEAVAKPVWFSDAVKYLHAWGAEAFVECSLSSMLTNLTRQCVPGVVAQPCLDSLSAASKSGQHTPLDRTTLLPIKSQRDRSS
jgi:acyl transferase domain-containing protein